jgi:hypothetical protein
MERKTKLSHTHEGVDMYNLFLLTLLFFVSAQAMQEEQHLIKCCKASSPGSKEKLHHIEGEFYVDTMSGRHKVDKAWLQPELRTLTPRQMKGFAKAGGYFQLKRFENGEYSFEPHIRVRGGGPILAGILYWGTKAVCYGGAAAAAGGVVAATGGGALGAVGSLAVGGATGGLTAGGTAVSLAVGGAGGATLAAATTGTAAVIGTAGSLGGAITFVESAAIVMGSIGAAIPFL